ncbi:CHASE domain-containing protein [Maritimibacter dapengensis]|uniref:histidine kinase n=1 Tax=Maritimibacter dapengensis TaxID=2836868 RepID=A0ABS6SXM6_9RHOB|nr:CHASE domain-containing protein [Maritimibacter dapengensis]MBV7377675.1 CHASE domain-containing protein [Maritimibacter dapengensis]
MNVWKGALGSIRRGGGIARRSALSTQVGAALALWFLAASLMILFLGRVILDAENARAEQEFRALAEANLSAIEDRMKRYDAALRGLAGLVAQSGPLSKTEYEAYADALISAGALPGASGLGFIEPVARDDLDAYVAQARRDGLPDFRIKSASARDESFVIRHIEPLSENAEALGLDIAFEPRRRLAAMRARASGLTTLSPAIVLVQDDSKVPGFVLFHPVDEGARGVGVDGDGDDGFKGWVFMPFVSSHALSDLSRRHNHLLDVSVFDNDEAHPDTLVFTTVDEGSSVEPQFSHSASLRLYGQTWHLRWNSRPAFDSRQNSATEAMIFLAAIILVLTPITALGVLVVRKQRLSELVAKRTKELLTQSSLTASLLEDESLFVFVFDEDGKCLLTNGGADMVLDRPMIRNNRDAFFRKLRHATTPGSRHVFRFDWNGEGETRVLSASRHDWVNSAGKHRMTFVSQDITNEFEAIQKSIDAEKRLNLALGVSEVGVFELNLETGESIVSDVWKKIMRYSDDAGFTNYQRYFKDRVVPEDLELLHQNDKACILGETDRSTTEFRVYLGGRTYWMRSEAIVSERSPDGRALRLIGTQVDITERKRLETAMSDFIATVSHELRTPITSVKGAVQLLAHKLSPEDKLSNKKLIDIALSNVDQLILLVNDILDFEQVQSNRMDFGTSTVSVSALLNEAQLNLTPYAASTDARLRLDLPSCDVSVNADWSRLLQVVTNLVSNACKFSPADTEVVIGFEVEKDTCRIFVRDHGPGIPPDFEADLFEPFAQADRSDSREHGGTGLGLAISQRFVERMDGQIGYRRLGDRTSEFWISFPVAAIETPEPARELA